MNSLQKKLLVTGFALCFGFASIAWVIVQQKTVTVTVDGEEQNITLLKGTVQDALLQCGVGLNPHDLVEPGLDVPLQKGMHIQVRRAGPVEVQVDGEKELVQAVTAPVSEVLRLAGITVSSDDLVSPGLDTLVSAGDTVEVVRVKYQEVIEETVVSHETEKRPDRNLTIGRSRVIQNGRDGILQETFKVKSVGGREVDREQVDKKWLQEVQKKIVAYGTAGSIARGGEEIRYKQSFTMVATAYTHTGSLTATGAKARLGVAAVDPRVIPLGSRLYIEGYGYATALDVGSAIKGQRIDVFLESEAACRRWGRKTVKVYLLD